MLQKGRVRCPDATPLEPPLQPLRDDQKTKSDSGVYGVLISNKYMYDTPYHVSELLSARREYNLI